MDLSTVLSQVLVLFILITIGLILKKTNIFEEDFIKGLSNFIIYATLPALLVTSLNYDFSKELLNNGLLILIIGPFAYLFAILIGLLFVKLKHIKEPDRGIYLFSMIFPNTAFMGYPVSLLIYGEKGLFYAVIFNLLFNMLLWTLGVILTNPKSNTKINFKMLINPGTISIAIGLVLFLFSITLPRPLFDALDSLGKATTPLAMIVIGTMLGDSSVGNVIKNKKLIAVVLIRLIIIPIPILFILSVLPIPKMVAGVIAILMAMPVAANAAIFARRSDSNYKLASESVFLSTLFSIATIPIFISLVVKLIGM
ncbi:MAG: AEC family transporter [Senegalia sp. (in: firmicutes)]